MQAFSMRKIGWHALTRMPGVCFPGDSREVEGYPFWNAGRVEVHASWKKLWIAQEGLEPSTSGYEPDMMTLSPPCDFLKMGSVGELNPPQKDRRHCIPLPTLPPPALLPFATGVSGVPFRRFVLHRLFRGIGSVAQEPRLKNRGRDSNPHLTPACGRRSIIELPRPAGIASRTLQRLYPTVIGSTVWKVPCVQGRIAGGAFPREGEATR